MVKVAGTGGTIMQLKGKWPDGAGVWEADTPKPLVARVLEFLTATA